MIKECWTLKYKGQEHFVFDSTPTKNKENEVTANEVLENTNFPPQVIDGVFHLADGDFLLLKGQFYKLTHFAPVTIADLETGEKSFSFDDLSDDEQEEYLKLKGLTREYFNTEYDN